METKVKMRETKVKKMEIEGMEVKSGWSNEGVCIRSFLGANVGRNKMHGKSIKKRKVIGK